MWLWLWLLQRAKHIWLGWGRLRCLAKWINLLTLLLNRCWCKRIKHLLLLLLGLLWLRLTAQTQTTEQVHRLLSLLLLLLRLYICDGCDEPEAALILRLWLLWLDKTKTLWLWLCLWLNEPKPWRWLLLRLLGLSHLGRDTRENVKEWVSHWLLRHSRLRDWLNYRLNWLWSLDWLGSCLKFGFLSGSSLLLCLFVRVVRINRWIRWILITRLNFLLLLTRTWLRTTTTLPRHISLRCWCWLTLGVGIIRLRELTLFVVSKSVDIFTSEASVLAASRGSTSLWTAHTWCLLNLRAARGFESLHFVSSLASEFSFVL